MRKPRKKQKKKYVKKMNTKNEENRGKNIMKLKQKLETMAVSKKKTPTVEKTSERNEV